MLPHNYQLPRRALVTIKETRIWELANGISGISLFNHEVDRILMLYRIFDRMRVLGVLESYPDPEIEPEVFDQEVLDVMINYCDDQGIGNIKSVIKNKDRVAIGVLVTAFCSENPVLTLVEFVEDPWFHQLNESVLDD